MTDTQHPITPPPELVQQWWDAIPGNATDYALRLAIQAARWAADQQLEADCEWVERETWHGRAWSAELRAAMRPQPPSLKEQALQAHERCAFAKPGDRDIVRLALEALTDD
jgi:hypothetical protein